MLLKESKVVYLGEIFPVIFEDHELLSDYWSPRKGTYGASALAWELHKTRDFYVLFTNFQVSSFFHRRYPIWFLQQVLSAHCTDEKMEIQRGPR